MGAATTSERGAIARILLEDGLVDEKQLRYAERIRSKLEDPRPLLDVLKELQYVSEDQVDAALSRHRTAIPLGELLLELGCIQPSELEKALKLQAHAADPKPRLGDILVQWPDLRIEVSGHTDAIGSDASNQSLSEKRAQAVLDYLVARFPQIGSVSSR